MAPGQGKIQPLPIKVLYTIDTSPQSYVTVLREQQDVFVHPEAADGQDLLGSVALKCLVKGICYASPECVPNRSSLDFSVYNLDPTLRGSTSSSRAFPTPAAMPPPASAWAGKGFLSWALSEDGAGKTLVRGRLVREYEFSPACFTESGGLEGLMAAAASASAPEDADGKGWGLEVTLTLRQLNPEGKNEFSGRRAFEDMLANGGKSTASAPLAVASSPVRGPAASRASMPPPKSPSPRRGSTRPLTSLSATAAPSRTAAVPPSPAKPKPVKDEPGTSSGTTARDRSRDTTPPPKPTGAVPCTPPTPSPSRARLLEMLKNEGKMSPDMARKLAGNPFLVRLLKTLPEGTQVPESAAAVLSPVRGKTAQHRQHHPSPTPSGSSGQLHPSEWAPAPNGCSNCGAAESEQWLTKRTRDGGSARVCHPCGMYFNKHKKMRPRDVWASISDQAGPSESAPAPSVAVRSSPRLNRTRPAPPPVGESPRKRARRAGPVPSPRMATRASTRDTKAGSTTPTPDAGTHVTLSSSDALGFSTPFSFSDDVFTAAPSSTMGNTNDFTNNTNGIPDDISLFLQFNDDEQPSGGITIDNLFGLGSGAEDLAELLTAIQAEEMGEGAMMSQSEP